MTREEKRETLQTFASFPPIVRQAIAAGKVFADLEKQTKENERPQKERPQTA